MAVGRPDRPSRWRFKFFFDSFRYSPPYLLLVFYFFTFINSSQEYISSSDIRKNFHNYEIINPVITSGSSRQPSRQKRSIHQPYDSYLYPQSIKLQYSTSNKNYVLNLKLNENLFTNDYYERHHEAGKAVSYKPGFNDLNHCYYRGKIDSNADSWVAVSTCNNHIQGVVDDGKDAHYIEPMKVNDTYYVHYLVKESSLKNHNLKCGFSGNNSFNIHSTIIKGRRLAEVKPPHSSNRYSRYVELILVSDKIEFEKFDEDKEVLFSRSKQIGNIVNALYAPLNIYIALVGVVVWSDHDEIKLSPDGDKTLTKFLEYRRKTLVLERANDNAQLITGLIFDEGVVGKALKGTICTHEYSGGVNMDHSKVVGLVATTVAHELGHNFGMEHDDARCECPASKCIMAPSSSSTRPSHWSSCSLDYLHSAYEQGMDHCLHNKPESLIGPVCGNGFLEDGEECDCGLKEHCDNDCCNPDTCQLFSNASCATGMCCDLSTCQVKPVAVKCRESIAECDLPEHCDGENEFCPPDVFLNDGTSCKNGKAHCVQGKCKTHVDQCRLLWGPTGMVSDHKCFKQNKIGTVNGNCGYDLIHKNYTACEEEDILCGMLHCTHLNEKLEFGMDSTSEFGKSFIRIGKGNKVLTCRSALVDLGVDVVDPGMAPDGAVCGKNKMCLNRKCVQILDVMKKCPYDCNNNGVCNSNGNCHCVKGFGPPYCDTSGPGGSIDSGPTSDPAAMYRFIVVMLVLFLGVIPLLIIIACVAYYFRRDLKGLWIGKARKAAIKKHPVQVVKPQLRPRSMSKFKVTDRASLRKLEISNPIPMNGSVAAVSPPLAQSMQERNSIRGVKISNPVLQSQTNKHIPVRPAPPKPSTAPNNWAVSEGIAPSTLQRDDLNFAKSNTPKVSSLNRRESGKFSRPSAPPPRPPSPQYSNLNNGACIDSDTSRITDNSAVKPYAVVYPVKTNGPPQKTMVASLTQRFENPSTSVRICTDSDGSSNPRKVNSGQVNC